jgi:hypothetical protein
MYRLNEAWREGSYVRELFWQGVVVLIAVVVIAVFSAALKLAFDGERLFIVVAALFWTVIVGSALIFDRRDRLEGRVPRD